MLFTLVIFARAGDARTHGIGRRWQSWLERRLTFENQVAPLFRLCGPCPYFHLTPLAFAYRN
jgi:hypothetical protein